MQSKTILRIYKWVNSNSYVNCVLRKLCSLCEFKHKNSCTFVCFRWGTAKETPSTFACLSIWALRKIIDFKSKTCDKCISRSKDCLETMILANGGASSISNSISRKQLSLLLLLLSPLLLLLIFFFPLPFYTNTNRCG